MIIKKFLNKIEINNYTLILIFLCLITGLFKEFIVIFSLIIVHEFGHYILMYKYKYNIDKIIIYPFGGITKFDDVIDKPLYEEFLITIAGPLIQYLFYLLILLLHNKYYITDYIYNLYKNYNYSILIFNLLPIIPLDGSKIVNIILNKLFNFRISYSFNIIISFLTLLIFIYFTKCDSSYFIILLFLIFQIIYSIKYRKIIYYKFLLEKRLYKNKYSKYKKINKINKMYRNKKHLIKDKNMYISENNYLKKYKF